MFRKSQQDKQNLQVARRVSYATSSNNLIGRAFIRGVENMTGRIDLIKRAQGYQDDISVNHTFWHVMMQRYGISLDIIGGAVDYIPRKGPLVVVANHPFGILDGLILGYILSTYREDFRIIAHRVFNGAADLDSIILPISFDETKEAMALNLKTRKQAIEFLKQGGAVGIFPGGTVSTSRGIKNTPRDPVWRNFTAKMISKSNATVLPLFFEGNNSDIFQLASRTHYTLRMALMLKEFHARVDRPVRVVVGKPISPDVVKNYYQDPKAMMQFLRAHTYALNPNFATDTGLGYEFEQKYHT